MRNKGHIKPVLNFQAGKLWLKADSTCWFEIRVYKDAVKAFPNRLYGCQTIKKKHNWPPKTTGYNEFKRRHAHTYANKNEEPLPKELA